MLPPDSRQLFHDLLAPPCGWSLDGAVGTTYSLDLESLIMVPLAFMRQAGRWEENETPDPVALLAALRRHAGQLTVFCQAGQVALSGSFPRLSQLMEPCVHEVLAPHREGVFHPKVWILRFVFRGDDEEEEERKAGQVRYRVLVMSRNLTMDRSWDLAVALEGDYRDDRQRAYTQNHPLADFVKTLPSLACRDLPEHRRQSVERMAEELRRVEFEMPDEFEPGEFLFQPTGFDPAQTPVNPLDYQIDRMLAVSPFLNESWLREAQQSCNEIHLISRQESLDALSLDCLQKCASLHTLHRQASVGEEDVDDLLQGLHAKCLVMDAGWNTHWRLGSHNATTAAWHRNVEFSVGFTAKRSTHGVEKILSASKKSAGEMLFADLLTPYLLESRSAAIEEDEAWKRQCLKTRRAIAEAHFYWDVSEREDGQFSCRLDCESEPDGLHEGGALAVRPMSVSEAWQRRVLPAGAAEFPNLSLENLTGWTVFIFTSQEKSDVWVTKLPLRGAPENLPQRVLARHLENPAALLRLLHFLMADEDDPSLGGLLQGRFTNKGAGAFDDGTEPLLEVLLRAAAHQPTTLQRVQDLLSDLSGSSVVSEELMAVWTPIWEAVNTGHLAHE